jgi:hypothetical protein
LKGSFGALGTLTATMALQLEQTSMTRSSDALKLDSAGFEERDLAMAH